MKKIRLYNVIFPVWMLFPQIWLIALSGNLFIDCVVVLLTLLVLKHTAKWTVLKQVWWRVWLWGFAADFVGVALLIFAMFALGFLPKPWNAWLAFVVTALAVAISGVHIYFFNKHEVFSRTELTDRERHLLCLTLAIVTAPWTFFIPMY